MLFDIFRKLIVYRRLQKNIFVIYIIAIYLSLTVLFVITSQYLLLNMDSTKRVKNVGIDLS